METIGERVISIIDAERLSPWPRSVRLGHTLSQLKVDSLARMSTAIELENEFGIEISDRAMDSWRRVRDVVKTVERAADRSPSL